MKRSNHKGKKGEAPVIAECAWCGHASRSKYEAKNHICKGARAHG